MSADPRHASPHQAAAGRRGYTRSCRPPTGWWLRARAAAVGRPIDRRWFLSSRHWARPEFAGGTRLGQAPRTGAGAARARAPPKLAVLRHRSCRAASSCRRPPGSSPRTPGRGRRTGSSTASSPTMRSRASPARSARCRATRSSLREHHRPGGPGAGVPDGLLPGSGRSPDRTNRHGPGPAQAAPVVTPGVDTVTCPWEPTLTLKVDEDVATRQLPLEAGRRRRARSSSSRSPSATTPARPSYVIQNSVTTWQAYNLWGGYSLYYGPDGTAGATSPTAPRVGVLRPAYPQTWAQGAADFFGNEFPLLYHLESLGLDLTYWTDVDLHADPSCWHDHRCLFSLGHDEYWSTPMRDGARSPGAGDQPRLSGGERLLPPDPPRDLARRAQSAAGLLQGRRRGPDGPAEPALTTVNWEQSAGRRTRERPLIGTHVPVGRLQRRAGGHRPVVVVLRRLRARATATLPQRRAGRVRPLRSPLPGPDERRRARPLAGAQTAATGPTSPTTRHRGGGVLASGSATFVSLLGNSDGDPAEHRPGHSGVTD